jgi:hypothetical protein
MQSILLLLGVVGSRLLVLSVNSVLLVNLLEYKWEIESMAWVASRLFLFPAVH